MRWRVLPMHTTNAYMAMAIDEAVAESVAAGRSPPTIRFWRWSPSAVSIGCFQGIEDEVNLQACAESGTDVVRRRTGGGAVFHDSDGEITYSVIAPEGMFPRGIRESYQMICGWAIEGLARMGIKAEFAPINDITVGRKKISGSAQTRRHGVLLQHGTILYRLDPEKMFSHLRVSKEKISDKAIQSVHDRVTKILDYNVISIDGAYKALLQGFVSGKEYGFGTLSTEEIARAHELAEKRYMSREWNFSR